MELFCEPWRREGKRSDSEYYCQTCNEVYCSACSKKHVTYKISLSHVINPIETMNIAADDQLYEEVRLLTTSNTLSQESQKEEEKSKFSDTTTHSYIDMSHATRSSIKGEAQNQTKSELSTVDTAYPYSYASVGENHTATTLMKSGNDRCQVKSDEHDTKSDQTDGEYPYSYAYADVNFQANTRVTGESLAKKPIYVNTGTGIETEEGYLTVQAFEADMHVYDETDENLNNSTAARTESTYVVKLIKSPLPVDELNGSFLLRLTPTGIELLHDRTGCKIYFWPIETIRKFGDDGRDVFCLDAGRRCGRWSGDFHFATESANDIRVQIGIIIQNIHAPQIKKHEANK